MPESLFNSNELDIRRLTVESPEQATRELPFDAERDMPEHFWTALTEAIEDCDLESRHGAIGILIEHLAVLRTIAPQRFQAEAVQNKVSALAKSQAKRLLLFATQDNWLGDLFHLKIIYPSEPIATSSAAWDDLKHTLGYIPGDIVSHYGKLRLIAPEYAENIEEQARLAWRDRLSEWAKTENIGWRVRGKADLRLCDDLLQPELVTTQDEWQRYISYFQSVTEDLKAIDAATYHQALRTLRQGLFDLQLLEASTITMTEEGLQLGYRQSDLAQPSEAPQLPEQRRY